MSRSQLEALHDAAETEVLLDPKEGGLYPILVRLAFHKSLTMDELLNIRLQDLDLSKKRPKIWIPALSVGGKPRMITLSRDLRERVVEYLHFRKTRIREEEELSEYLFTDGRGLAMSRPELEKRLQRLCTKAGLSVPSGKGSPPKAR